MPDGNSQSTSSAAGPVDWERRARRMEMLCALATDTAATVSPDEIWAHLRSRAAESLGASAAALSTPLLATECVWVGEGWGAAGAETVRALVGEEVDDVRLVPVPNGVAVLAPLRHQGEATGTLLLAWASGAETDEEMRGVVGLLAGQAAAALANARAYGLLTDAALRRERFFSAMSHDLRTPITAIVGYSELLADGIVGDLTGQQQEMVERICQVSGQLSQLVNDILDLAKLDAGRMEFHCEEVSLGGLVDEALVTVGPQARSKGLELRTEIEPFREHTLCVDPPRVRQILVNLLSNAVKFTEQGVVAVAAGRDSDDGRPWIEVRDTGPGLPAGSEEAVFEEFLQLSSSKSKSKREPGSGLGLAISRRLARAMGGDLVVRNAPSTGAAFTLVLPAAGG